jgi:hypothetical protein
VTVVVLGDGETYPNPNRARELNPRRLVSTAAGWLVLFPSLRFFFFFAMISAILVLHSLREDAGCYFHAESAQRNSARGTSCS